MTEENAMRLARETVEPSEDDTGRKFLTLLVLGFFMVIVGFILVAIVVIVSQVDSSSFGGILFIGLPSSSAPVQERNG